jgi:hypothetical protein
MLDKVSRNGARTGDAIPRDTPAGALREPGTLQAVSMSAASTRSLQATQVLNKWIYRDTQRASALLTGVQGGNNVACIMTLASRCTTVWYAQPEKHLQAVKQHHVTYLLKRVSQARLSSNVLAPLLSG